MRGLAERPARVLGPWIALCLLGTQLAVPYLDRNLSHDIPVLGTEHEAGTCIPHDHDACVRLGANPWAPSEENSGTGVLPTDLALSLGEETDALPIRSVDSFHARAPPLG